MISWFNQQGNALRLALRRLGRTPLANMLGILVIGLALSLPAGLYRLVTDVSTMGRSALHEPKVTLFMARDADAAALQAAWVGLQADPAVLEVRYISNAEALAELKATPGLENAVGVLEKNPLPHVFVVRARDASPAGLEALRSRLSGWDKVERAQLDGEWARRLAALLEWSYRIVLGLAAILAVALVSVIVNTVRLQILAARDEIEVSHLIGATHRYIRRPFLYFGFLQGILGAIVAALLVLLGTHQFNGMTRELLSLFGLDLQLQTPTPLELLELTGLAGALGWIAAYLSVAAYLPRPR